MGICWTMNKIFDMAIPSRSQAVLVLWHDLVLRHDLVLSQLGEPICRSILLWCHQEVKNLPKAMGLLLAIEVIKICFGFLFRFLFHQPDVRKIWQFIIRLWLGNVYSELYSQTNFNSNKNLKSSFEISLHILWLFLLNILASLISLTVSTYTRNS